MTWSQSCFYIVCLRHFHTKHNLRAILHFQFSQKSIENFRWRFFAFLYKNKFLFLFVFCTRKRHSIMIEDYVEKDDVIIEINFHSLLTRRNHVTQFDLTWLDSIWRYSIWFNATSFTLFLEQFETERICFWLMILLNRRLLFVSWICKLNRLIRQSFFLWWSEFECQCV